MYPTVCNIYGKFQISSFSCAIAIGILVFIWLATRDKKLIKLISKDDFVNLTIETAIFAIIGGRLLEVIIDYKNYHSFYDVISIWQGGATVLGNIIVAILYGAWYLKRRSIPIIPVLDRAAIYVPIIHAFGRIGCFLVGCCFGTPTNLPWAIIYKNPEIIAPIHTAIHPTQIYSALTFFGIFLFMKFVASKFFTKTGQLLLCYIVLSCTERIIIDFFRGDRINIQVLSSHQWISILVIIISILVFAISKLFRIQKTEKYESI